VSTVTAPAWHLRAACQYTDPDLFFAEDDGLFEATSVASDQARRVCLGCPVRPDCLRHALNRPETHGTWGGLTERELRRERAVRLRRPAAEVLAEADARYFRRQDRIAAAAIRLAAKRQVERAAREYEEVAA
jgi:WhiB family redox-sensing transcriptional regulator